MKTYVGMEELIASSILKTGARWRWV